MTTRTMGDATHLNVPALAKVTGLQLVAGYVTGSPDIQWTASDWRQFSGKTAVMIDQGFTGSPEPSATVRDVEAGAWTPVNAVDAEPWIADRPTIYCNMSTLPVVLSAGWKGDLWLAIPGHTGPPPAVPGCTVVAIQNDYSNPAYDLSVVYEPYWPALPPEADVIEIPGVPGKWLSVQQFTDLTNQTPYIIGLGTDGRVWMTKRVNGAWTGTVRL